MEIKVDRGGFEKEGLAVGVVIEGGGLTQSGVIELVSKEPICLDGGREVVIREGAWISE